MPRLLLSALLCLSFLSVQSRVVHIRAIAHLAMHRPSRRRRDEQHTADRAGGSLTRSLNDGSGPYWRATAVVARADRPVPMPVVLVLRVTRRELEASPPGLAPPVRRI